MSKFQNLKGENIMAKTRIEKIEDIDAKMAQMANERNELIAAQKVADRKARDHRVCQRGGYIESVLPEVIGFTFEQFKTFITKTLTTDFAKKILAQIAEQPNEPQIAKPSNAETPATQGLEQNKAVANQPEKK
jgi:chorismate mutase